MVKADLSLDDNIGSPLDGKAIIETRAITLEQQPFSGKLIIRGAPQLIAAPVKKVIKADLPLESGSKTITRTLTVYWLGPDEWMVIGTLSDIAKHKVSLTETFKGLHASVVEMSNYYCEIRLEGAEARDLLAKGTPIDLRDTSFAIGQIWQTCFAHANLIIDRQTEDRYQLMVRWSMAAYLWDRLAETIGNAG